MIHVQYGWIQKTALGRLITKPSMFISFKGNTMWHSPDYEYKTVPVEEVYGGPPGPDIDVQEWHFWKLDLQTGNQSYASSGYDFLTDGPKLLNQIFGLHYLYCSQEIYSSYDFRHVSQFCDHLSPDMGALFDFMAYDEDAKTFSRKSALRLPKGTSIASGSIFERDAYRWRRNFFECNNKVCTFEQILQQAIYQHF